MDAQVRSPDAHAIAALRALTYRITSTPTKSLPSIAAQISGAIWNCKEVLSISQENTKGSPEAATAVNRFRTTLTSLLQDRTIEGRWSAVVLAKAAIEAGGLTTLSKCNGWVKSLLSILKRPTDPPTTRLLCTVVLTRIFQLTWPHQELVREITTPSLPAFISACLANASRNTCGAGELEAVLEAFCVLVPRHPTVFRSHETQIRDLLTRILSVTSGSESDVWVSKGHQQAAATLLVLLAQCAPKQGGGEVWAVTWAAAVESAHQTCDILFRSIIEEDSSKGHTRQPTASTGEAGLNGPDALGLAAWKGIYAGSERLTVLLHILRAHLETPFTGSLTIRLGLLIQLISRILSVTLELESDSSSFNHQIPKDEREALFTILPEIHVATLELLDSLLRRFGKAAFPFAQTLLEQTLSVFQAEKTDSIIRRAAYTAINPILEIIGPILTRPEVAEFDQLIRGCCNDLSPIAANNAQLPVPTSNTSPTTSSKSTAHPTALPNLENAASSLLITLASKINPTAMPNKLRLLIERTAIHTRNKEALVACVLNPMRKPSGRMGSSLLPILAREFSGAPEVEALLRPRMPPVVSKADESVVDEMDFEVDSEVAGQDSRRDGRIHTSPARELDNGLRHDFLQTSRGASKNGAESEAEGEDLYSVTPPRQQSQTINTTNTGSTTQLPQSLATNGLKRPADTTPIVDEEVTKRSRPLPDLDAAASTKVPLPVQLDTVNVEPQAVVTKAQPIEPIAAAEDGMDDESDFEMPPLTMEASDEEDEDDEE